MSSASKIAAGMLVASGIAFVILVVTTAFIIIPLDIVLNVVICVGNAFAIKVYKDQGNKSAATASLLLLITEAAWIALPIILIVPIALLQLAIHRVKAAHDAQKRIVGSILAFAALGLSIPFIPVVLSLVFTEGFGFSVGSSLLTEGIFVTWPLFFISRDVIPGILLLLGEGDGGIASSEPGYKTFIEATSST